MLPSASLSATDENGKACGMYEPVHGSAPDIAGQNKANPLASILSFAMALRYSLNLGEEADRLEKAVDAVLASGMRTGDIMSDGMQLVGWRRHGRRRFGRISPKPNQRARSLPFSIRKKARADRCRHGLFCLYSPDDRAALHPAAVCPPGAPCCRPRQALLR